VLFSKSSESTSYNSLYLNIFNFERIRVSCPVIN
jgi:hypothetical protein